MSASSRIDRYLKDRPNGDLLIAVGYATAPGIAWLARRTAGRRVALLIGDTRSQWWKKMSEPDRSACLAFIHRGDVEIRNWYRTNRSRNGESAAHLKVWAVHDNWTPMSVLAGSGNLTRKGLDDNVEVMVEAHGNDRRQAWTTVRDLWEKAWPCADRLTEYLVGPQPPAESSRSRATASARSSATATPRHPTGTDHTRRPQPPPRPRAPAHNTRSAARTETPTGRRSKQAILRTISGWISASALTATTPDHTQRPSPGTPQPDCPRCARSDIPATQSAILKKPRCGWCGTQLTPRHLRRHQHEPFIAYRRHSPELADLHTQASALDPDPHTIRWEPPQRLLILRYLMWRDDEQCGLCAMALPAPSARIEHVAPLQFGRFDHQHGTAEAGSEYESRLHHVDNLQAVHDHRSPAGAVRSRR